ncbi:MAG: HEPN domain-containing protein, partial [Nocardioides sp.]
IVWTDEGNGQRSMRFPQETTLDHLRARLANGYIVDLVDVSVRFWLPERATIKAASATVGLSFAPAGGQLLTAVVDADQGARATDASADVPTYSSAEIQVGALDAIAGTSPFSHWTFPNHESPRHLDGDWTISGNPDSTQEWTDEKAQLRLEYDASIAIGNPYAFRFVVSPVVRINLSEPITVREWVDEWADPLRRIASIATGAPQDLTYLAMRSPNESGSPPRWRRRQVFGSGITQSPYQSTEQAVRKASTALHIAADQMSLLEMVRHWQQLTVEHHPLIETYGSMLSIAGEHPRSRFLLLIQAMEGLHGHESATTYDERSRQHTQIRDLVLRAVDEASILDGAQRRFLNRNLMRRPPRGLDEALRHLLEMLPTDMTPRLLHCELIQKLASTTDGTDIHRVATALATVRNDLAHGNRGYNAHDLHDVVEHLEKVVRAHSLRLLGCPDAVLQRVCEVD